MFEREIQRGLDYLDKYEPGWEGRVAVDQLNMHRADRCVLGQLDGTPEGFWGYLYTRGLDAVWAVYHGFLFDDGPALRIAWFDVLHNEWGVRPDLEALMRDRRYRESFQNSWVAAIRARQVPAPEVAPIEDVSHERELVLV